MPPFSFCHHFRGLLARSRFHATRQLISYDLDDRSFLIFCVLIDIMIVKSGSANDLRREEMPPKITGGKGMLY